MHNYYVFIYTWVWAHTYRRRVVTEVIKLHVSLFFCLFGWFSTKKAFRQVCALFYFTQILTKGENLIRGND